LMTGERRGRRVRVWRSSVVPAGVVAG
jgi:hypothetical protein